MHATTTPLYNKPSCLTVTCFAPSVDYVVRLQDHLLRPSGDRGPSITKSLLPTSRYVVGGRYVVHESRYKKTIRDFHTKQAMGSLIILDPFNHTAPVLIIVPLPESPSGSWMRRMSYSTTTTVFVKLL